MSSLTRTNRICFALGGFSSATAVALSAAAAHALKGRLDDYALELLILGAQFQLWHGIALIIVGLLPTGISNHARLSAALTFFLGIACFSGGLYNIAFQALPALHFVVPIGGSLLIIGWLIVAITALVSKGEPST